MTHLMPTYPQPLATFVKGEGSYLYDDSGRRYLDLLSGLAVTSLGHAHPEVAATIAEQSAKLLHVSNLFGNEHNEPLARAIDALHGGGGLVFFANSGAEANECAIKLARKFGGRGRHTVVSTLGSFHGRTLATLHATGQPYRHETFQPMPEGFHHIPWNDLDALDTALNADVAAILIEIIQGEGGVNPADETYLQAIRNICTERGILMMIDEIQTGLARTGDWFAYQHHGIKPDVVTMAKALGNGMPIGACWARQEVAEVFEPGDHATTFGGQPLAAAAARTVIDIMQRENLPQRVTQYGDYFTEQLLALDGVITVRGRGLLLGVELDLTNAHRGDNNRSAADIQRALLEQGVVANAVTPTALRFAPSLLISTEEIDEAVTTLDFVLNQLSATQQS